MGRLSRKQIDKIEMLCNKINHPDVSNIEKEQAYRALNQIYDSHFVELQIKSSQVKGS